MPDERGLSLVMGGWSVSGTFPPDRGAAGSWPVLQRDPWLSCERNMSWQGSAHSLEVLWTKGQDQGRGSRNPNGKLFGSLL